jgi:hypothetical protein
MPLSQIQVKSGKSEETIKNPAMGIAAGKNSSTQSKCFIDICCST